MLRLRSCLRVVSNCFVVSFPSGFEECAVCCFVCAWAHSEELLGSPRERLGVLRGRLGEAFGSFGGVLGDFWELLEPLETPLGASGASQGGFWVLPEHLREALGSSRDALGIVSGCFWDVSGNLLGLREGVGSGQDAKVKIIVFLKELLGF